MTIISTGRWGKNESPESPEDPEQHTPCAKDRYERNKGFGAERRGWGGAMSRPRSLGKYISTTCIPRALWPCQSPQNPCIPAAAHGGSSSSREHRNPWSVRSERQRRNRILAVPSEPGTPEETQRASFARSLSSESSSSLGRMSSTVNGFAMRAAPCTLRMRARRACSA
jgi:hypothetical protein